MNSVEAALRRIAADLDRRHLGWALVGGFAVSARSEPRFTRDVDIVVAVEDDRVAEQIVHGLVSGGYQLLASVEQDAVDRLATVRLSPVAAGDVVVDLLFASSGIEPEIVQSAEEIEVLPALTVPVARTGHLIAVKLLARDDKTRPQDLADLHSLLEVATPGDLDLAGRATGLITERGFHWDRDLAAALASLLAHEVRLSHHHLRQCPCSRGDHVMNLTLIAKDIESGKNDCPAFYDLEEAPEDCVIQGHLLDSDTAANLLNVLPGESAVRMKKQVLIDALTRLGL